MQLKIKAFTLAEIIIAIVILSGSLVVLIGLLSSVVSKSLGDRQRMSAMMFARSLFAAIEANGDFSPRSESNRVFPMLQSYNAIPGEDEQLRANYNNMSADLQIEEWQVPSEIAASINASGNILNRIYLKVYWGETIDDQIELVFFVPN